ncbi:hypothetical protein HELRODRAFT_176480 [Helobdella robusta]|uniref:Fibrinogen C-terminal domain-containing protein n=1 Tax=Helobdella robusta TaxID=6412 RepID=T1FAK1_HELRO|nr:hypothetical protein HELRODRAFT_176480 [Helobdella robusta]ESN99720.1 hypothetical protein HELRODRAFT_176480 [Helobdella robusta]
MGPAVWNGLPRDSLALVTYGTPDGNRKLQMKRYNEICQIVMQRRMNGRENFYRNWTEYQRGFGDPKKEFWIGNENIYRLTAKKKFKVLFVSEDFEDNVACAAYDSFSVGSPDTYYVLNIGNYHGTAGDSMINSNGMAFSTHDKDNDVRDFVTEFEVSISKMPDNTDQALYI